jgi:carboxypeptidase C (cathepsin A)
VVQGISRVKIAAFLHCWRILRRSALQSQTCYLLTKSGHYIPVFAYHINEMNKVSTLDEQIPLESVLIGNGIFSDTKQASSYYDIPCTNVTGIGPLLESSVCEQMAAAVGRCEYLMKACHAYPDPIICESAERFCSAELEGPYFNSGRNFYDISRPCEG